MSVSFPIEKKYHYQWITIKAEMDVRYPSPLGSNAFTNVREHLVREIRFFVVSPEEYQMLSHHESWREGQEELEFNTRLLPIMLVTSAIGIVGFGVYYGLSKLPINLKPSDQL